MPPNGTTKDISRDKNHERTGTHGICILSKSGSRLFFFTGTNPPLPRKSTAQQYRKTETASWTVNAVTPWSSGVVLCFTPSPLLSATRPRERVHGAQAPFPRASEKPERGLLPRSMSANIPDSGSWHRDIATSMAPTDPFFGDRPCRDS